MSLAPNASGDYVALISCCIAEFFCGSSDQFHLHWSNDYFASDVQFHLFLQFLAFGGSGRGDNSSHAGFYYPLFFADVIKHFVRTCLNTTVALPTGSLPPWPPPTSVTAKAATLLATQSPYATLRDSLTGQHQKASFLSLMASFTTSVHQWVLSTHYLLTTAFSSCLYSGCPEPSPHVPIITQQAKENLPGSWRPKGWEPRPDSQFTLTARLGFPVLSCWLPQDGIINRIIPHCLRNLLKGYWKIAFICLCHWSTVGLKNS